MENVECNICGKDDYIVIYKAKYSEIEDEDALVEKFKSSGDELLIDQVVKCNNCKLIYINPRIRPDLVVKGYSLGEDPDFVSQARGREITFVKSLKLIEKYAKKGRVLDVGTAGGSFLHVAKKRGWEVYGVEPSKWLCDWGKQNYGIDIKPGTIYDGKFEDDFFDMVSLWDVLEHVPNPKKELLEINRVLKKDGVLVVNYPDIGSWLSKAMGRKWIFLLSVHLFYFTRRTIKKILRDSGFEVVLIKPHFQKLSLGYLIHRMEQYNKPLSKVSGKVVNVLGLNNFQIAYWLGQTLVISKKK